MKIMAWFAVAVALLLTVRVVAQETGKPDAPPKPQTPARPQTPPRPGDIDITARLQELTDDLKLTEDQKAKVGKIVADAREELDKLREQARSAGGDRRDAVRKIMEKVRGLTDQINGVLTDEQKTLFREKLAKARERFGGGAGGPGGPAGAVDRLKQALGQLDLTEEQKTKLKEVGEDLRTKAEQIMNTGGAEAREKLLALRDEGMKLIKPILTDEQYKKLEELMKQPAAGGAEGRPAAMLQRFEEILPQLNLSEEQKSKVRDTIASAKKRLEEAREQAKTQPGEAREKLRQIAEDVRGDLQTILTPEQKEKLQSLMPGAGARPNRGNQ